MRRICAVLMFIALPLMAQDQKKPEPAQAPSPMQRDVQRLFILKYADVNQVSQLIVVFTGNVKPNPAMHAITVSAPPAAMSAIEDAIKRLDVPSSAPQNVEIMIYLLMGSSDSPQSLVGIVGSEPPKELEPTVSQLRNAFAYKDYKLMEVLPIRARTGQRTDASSAGSAVRIEQRPVPINTQVRIDSVTAEADGRIRLNGLRVGQRVPTPTVSPAFSYADLGITTDIDLKEGQKVVIGKSGLSPTEAIFLILTARVVQ